MRGKLHYIFQFLVLLTFMQCSETKVVESFPQKFYGLGIEVEIRNDNPVITFVHKKSPAEESQMLAGDIIEAIDGKTTKGLTLAQVVMLIRGPPHSQIMLHIKRHQHKMTLILRRREIHKGPAGYQGSTQEPVSTNE
tara:strand:- start:1472 stop:1882 length:411 start_codon:yes stop_codon:yes gene_type:complete